MNTRDVLAFANGVYSAHIGLDATGNPYVTGASARYWIAGWRRMRRLLDAEKKDEQKDK